MSKQAVQKLSDKSLLNCEQKIVLIEIFTDIKIIFIIIHNKDECGIK